MKIKLVAVGEKMPAWVNEAVDEYQRRLPKELGFELVSVAMSKRSKTKSVQNYKTEEAEQIRAATAKCSKVIALEVLGKAVSTEQIVNKMDQWRGCGDTVALLVGGPDGLDEGLSAAAHERWSLSGLTLPHPLVRVMLVEQIYRAWSFSQGHPYHR